MDVAAIRIIFSFIKRKSEDLRARKCPFNISDYNFVTSARWTNSDDIGEKFALKLRIIYVYVSLAADIFSVRTFCLQLDVITWFLSRARRVESFTDGRALSARRYAPVAKPSCLWRWTIEARPIPRRITLVVAIPYLSTATLIAVVEINNIPFIIHKISHFNKCEQR